jgi:NIPSNAP
MTTLAASRPQSSLFRRAAVALAAAAATLLSACETMGASDSTPPTPAIGLYELRTYTAAPGKLAALDARFRDHTITLFQKHGMTPIAFFHVAPTPGQTLDNRLIYVMGYKDRAARDAAWTAFAGDPEWRQVYADSQKDGSLTSKIENVFMSPTDYSPRLNLTPSSTARHFELRTYTAMPGRLEDLHTRFRDHTLRIFAKHGMTNYLYWRPVADQPAMTDKMVYLLAFPSQAARGAAWAAFGADPEWTKVAADSQKTGPMLATPGGVVSIS